MLKKTYYIANVYIQIFLLIFLVHTNICLKAQSYEVSGTVYDKDTEETIPLASVKINNVNQGVLANLDGYFIITSNILPDTITVSVIGYQLTKIPFNQYINGQNIYISHDQLVLDEVVIDASINPAHRIIKNVVANKKYNDKRLLDAYQFEAYSRIEVDMDNLSEKFKEKKLTKKLGETFESVGTIRDEEGREVLPVFISETISDYYYKKKPELTKEYVKATKVTGIGITDGSLASQLAGSSFQQFNFYENTLSALDKEFVSPISDFWKQHYEYFLEDSLNIGGFKTYLIRVKPKRPQSLTFRGFIWVRDSVFSITKLDLKITKEADLNYIDEVRIVQEFEQTSTGPWLATKSTVTVDVEDLASNWASMLVKSFFSCKNIIVNNPLSNKFYEHPIEVADNPTAYNDEYWSEARHYDLSKEEERSFVMLDSLKNMPVIRSYVDVFQAIVNGHKPIGKFEIGPYLSTYAWNKIEGHRIRVGGRTNADFSKKIIFNGYLAYGTHDKAWKYSIQARYILSRKPWTEIGAERRHDIDQLGITDLIESSLFETFSRWGNLRGAHYNTVNKFYYFRQLTADFSQRITFINRDFNPLFNFSYIKLADQRLEQQITSSEIVFETRFAKNEMFLTSDNNRTSLGAVKYPIITAQYILGINDFINSDFQYHKLSLSMNQSFGLGAMGRSRYMIRTGKTFSTVPYPLLFVHLGNQTPFFNYHAFNMMNFFEFVSDQYVSFGHTHHFNGWIMNRIPLMKRLKWRVVTNFNAIYGDLSQQNRAIIPQETVVFTTFKQGIPYMEMGYGIENIFRVFRIQVFHRLNYFEQPDARKVGIKATLQFTL